MNRTFTVTGGEVSAYSGTHMAICSLGARYPVDPKSCQHDAFKVR